MSETIQDLYDSFSAQMEPIQEDDRYFRYLFEMAQASDTIIEQKREELEKVVDEEWLTVIEDSLDAINAIIEKPRRFITTEEEVVPVSLARRISADSVRHLSQNTRYLAPTDDGEVHPTHVLNVSTAETYDLYENRFVYHLIQRLLAFVDKRTDVIFWSTGNEICNRFKMHSKIDDAYEEIEYTVEMSVKNRQSFAENDADNMDTFMRIDRVRRLVTSLANSSFCKFMAGCAAVRSPIQRTNLMTKDPNYRTCYRLWQFMERYDEVGYTINVKDSQMAFDDEYLIQMYTNLINNYTVFKSLTTDERNLSEVESEQREPVKPKFAKELKEELVADPDIPDVEIRRVFVEEVTQAQLVAEAALEAEREESAKLREQVERLTAEAAALADERDAAASAAAEADERANAANRREQLAVEKLQQANGELAQKDHDLAAAERERAAAQDAYEQAIAEQKKAEDDAQAARDEADERIQTMQADAESKIAAAQTDADERVACEKAEGDKRLEEALAQAEERLASAEAQAASRLRAAQDEAEATIADLQERSSEQAQAAKRELDERDAKLEETRKAAAAEIEQVKADAARELEAERENAAAVLSDRLAEAQSSHEAEMLKTKQEMQQRIEALIRDLEQTEKARAQAQRRAEGNSLSRYLLKRLRGLDEAAGNEDGKDGSQ